MRLYFCLFLFQLCKGLSPRVDCADFLFNVLWRIMQAASQSLHHLLGAIVDFIFPAILYKDVSGLTENELHLVLFTCAMDLLYPFIVKRP